MGEGALFVQDRGTKWLREWSNVREVLYVVGGQKLGLFLALVRCNGRGVRAAHEIALEGIDEIVSALCV